MFWGNEYLTSIKDNIVLFTIIYTQITSDEAASIENWLFVYHSCAPQRAGAGMFVVCHHCPEGCVHTFTEFNSKTSAEVYGTIWTWKEGQYTQIPQGKYTSHSRSPVKKREVI